MVMLAVRTFGQSPVTCNARSLLFQSHADLERGALFSAGVLMREALRVYLVAECEYWGCLPEKKKRRSPSLLVKALCKEVTDFGADWLFEIIDYGNQLAHCQHVPQKRIETCLSILHMYLDAAPYLQQPAAAGRLA